MSYNDIDFKSISEVRAYKLLSAEGFDVKYEEFTTTLIDKHRISNIKFYKGAGKGNKDFILNNRALLPTTYTPDFTFIYKNYLIIFDIKGFPNDTYPIKRKLFLKELDMNDCYRKYTGVIFFEPYSISQVRESVQIIKSL